VAAALAAVAPAALSFYWRDGFGAWRLERLSV